ncbi:MAG TPA: SRPBCC family protein [Rhizomicrobium sp.]
MTNEPALSKDTPLILTRLIDAPRALVFKAWTDPRHLARWWGPKDFTAPRCEADARPGGILRVDMRGPDGTIYPMSAIFDEIVAPERIVFTGGASDAKGELLFNIRTTVTLTEQEGKTLLTLEARVLMAGPQAAASLAGARQGWTQSLERLASLCESKGAQHSTFRIERDLAAPLARVYAAFADKDSKARWFGAADREYTVLEHSFDFRVGGKARARGRWKSGTVSDFHARYWEILPKQRLVYAYEMHLDEKRISVSLATVEFFAQGTGTKLVVTEEGAFLNGYDDAGSREQGTNFLIDRLAKSLES